eukprot:1158013-Pelagomonas_calceolata.AAC.7
MEVRGFLSYYSKPAALRSPIPTLERQIMDRLLTYSVPLMKPRALSTAVMSALNVLLMALFASATLAASTAGSI